MTMEKRIKLSPWDMAAIEVALKEKAAHMADKDNWERLVKLFASAECVSVKKFEHKRPMTFGEAMESSHKDRA